MTDGERALDEDVPDEASGGGQGHSQESRPASQEGVGEEEGQDDGVESVEEISDRSD
jgi:hypothetical protein